ncbi:kinase-like domain-containing protein [Mycena amicta]|nr:kinase-like domain-containing protein [Mycena amicta]
MDTATRGWFRSTFDPSYSRSSVQTALAGSINDIIPQLAHILSDPIRGQLLYTNNPREKVGILFDHLDAQTGHIKLVLAFKQAVSRHGGIKHMLKGDSEDPHQISNAEMRQNGNTPYHLRNTLSSVIFDTTHDTATSAPGRNLGISDAGGGPLRDGMLSPELAGEGIKHKPFLSEEFWDSTTLQECVTLRNHDFWQAVGVTSGEDIEERTKWRLRILTILPQSLIMLVYQTCRGSAQPDILPALLQRSTGSEMLDSLANYSEDVISLIRFLTIRKVSIHIDLHINRDLLSTVARLVLYLRKPASYQEFIACRGASIPPQCFSLTNLDRVGEQVAAGGFGDIWKGLIRGQTVSVKSMRLFRDSDIQAALKEFGQEALIWRQLSHPNVLPFFGIYYLEKRLCLVSPWMENGNIAAYLEKSQVSVSQRLSFMLDIAHGLQYLHGNQIVHGDLKAVNILVTPSDRACITDFGLTSIVDTMTLCFSHSTMTVKGGTTRYQAPELLHGEKRHFGSDIYAFGCTCYEILSGRVPFYEIKNDAAVVLKVVSGARPSHYPQWSVSHQLEGLWRLLQQCWDESIDKRPTADDLVERLQAPPILATTATSQSTDWDETFTSKFRRSLQVQSLPMSTAQITRAAIEPFQALDIEHDTGLEQDLDCDGYVLL